MPTYLSTRRSSTVYDSTVPTLRPFRDATGVVVVAVLLAYLLPTQLVFLPLSSLGRPGLVVGLGLLIWWLVTRLHPELATHGRQPMRWALLGYVAALGASYLAGQLRGLPALEQNGADRAILATLAGGGIMLAVADGVLNRERIERILRWLCWASSGMALVALGQFALRVDLTVYMRLPPLLVFQRDPVGFDARGGGGLVRVAGTAGHYIEFSVLMVIGLLIAIHLARFAPTRRSRQLFGALAMVQAAVIPISLSRTGVLALAAAILLLLVAWPLRTSFNVLALGLVLAVVIQVVRPGLLATLRALVLVGNRDPSVQGRLEDYDYVRPYFEGRPWFGRGVGHLADRAVSAARQPVAALAGHHRHRRHGGARAAAADRHLRRRARTAVQLRRRRPRPRGHPRRGDRRRRRHRRHLRRAALLHLPGRPLPAARTGRSTVADHPGCPDQ